MTRLPGVSSSDFSSRFTVRGGEDDEILITLDGMPLYEPFHQRDYSGGLFSIVDIETLQGIELNTGGSAPSTAPASAACSRCGRATTPTASDTPRWG